jgi:Ubiquitin carboxyl-terminal hydrolase
VTVPHTLVVTLKRFTVDQDVKIHTSVVVDDTVHVTSMGGHVTQYDASYVVCHIGEGVSTGHYVTYRRRSVTSPWVLFNDNVVTVVGHLPHDVTATCYLCVYIKHGCEFLDGCVTSQFCTKFHADKWHGRKPQRITIAESMQALLSYGCRSLAGREWNRCCVIYTTVMVKTFKRYLHTTLTNCEFI